MRLLTKKQYLCVNNSNICSSITLTKRHHITISFLFRKKKKNGELGKIVYLILNQKKKKKEISLIKVITNKQENRLFVANSQSVRQAGNPVACFKCHNKNLDVYQKYFVNDAHWQLQL